MIDLHLSRTPNGQKIVVFLEETGVPHRLVPMSLSRGDQYKPEFQKISPNNKIPAIVDHSPADGGPPITMFESGAILLYLAEKHDVLLPRTERERFEVLQWLFWQVGGLGPMAGQIGHFNVHAPERAPYALERYARETKRLMTSWTGAWRIVNSLSASILSPTSPPIPGSFRIAVTRRTLTHSRG
jgi:GST-like protein